MFTDLNTKQITAAQKAVGALDFVKHVQSYVSPVDGLATVQVFRPGRKVQTITIGPRGGIKRNETTDMD